MDYIECKFYEGGKCTHEEAPKNDQSCIGYDACGARNDDISHKKEKTIRTVTMDEKGTSQEDLTMGELHEKFFGIFGE